MTDSSNQGRPNVVFIVGDNVGWGDIGCYGGTAPTPRIDALAAEGQRLQELQRRGAVHTDALGDSERPSADPNRQLQRAASGAGRVRTRTVGVHARRVVLRRRVRHCRLRQVARRRRRGQTADRSGLRRVVRHQEHLGRGRLQLIPPVCRVGGRGSQDLGGREGIACHSCRGLQHGDAAACRREDRDASCQLHQAKRRGRQALLHLRLLHADASAPDPPSRLDGEVRRRRLLGHACRARLPHRPGAGRNRRGGDRRQHHRRLEQ